MIKVKNLTTGYGSNEIIKNMNFQLAGENLSIIGPNGCGKSTLLKAMVNILPFKGEIEINNKSIKKMNTQELAKNAALLKQSSFSYFPYSIYDTVMMGRYIHIKNKFLNSATKEDRNIVLSILETLNLLDMKDKSIMEISGGQLQRVFLGRTLAQEPKVILLDEPTNHLDLKYQINLIEYLKQWSSTDGNMVVGVMHDINHAMTLSQNILLMDKGQIVAYGKREDVTKPQTLEAVYGIDVAGYMKKTLSKWK
ncbi:MAG: ABC transporter ATP-binding protein [Lachnospirales bacterium]